MKRLAIALISAPLLLCACSTAPRSTGLLEQVRTEYGTLRNDLDADRFAPLEKQDATAAMNQANIASVNRMSADEIDHLAGIAKSKIDMAEEVTKRKRAETEKEHFTIECERMILTQRAKETKQAKQSAEQAQQTARAALATASTLQRTNQEAQERAAKLEAQLAELSGKKTDRGVVITLGDVLFGFDKATLSAAAQNKVQKLASVLKQYPERNVLIEGYTDSIGKDEYNLLLSERRANAVKQALHNNGITDDRVRIRGYGKDFPLAPNDSAENRQINRRVEIVLSDENGQIRPR